MSEFTPIEDYDHSLFEECSTRHHLKASLSDFIGEMKTGIGSEADKAKFDSIAERERRRDFLQLVDVFYLRTFIDNADHQLVFITRSYFKKVIDDSHVIPQDWPRDIYDCGHCGDTHPRNYCCFSQYSTSHRGNLELVTWRFSADVLPDIINGRSDNGEHAKCFIRSNSRSWCQGLLGSLPEEEKENIAAFLAGGKDYLGWIDWFPMSFR
jgi:hypothetical protein